MQARTLNVMNLPFTVLVDTPRDGTVVELASDGVENVLNDIDQRFSPFRPDSLVCRYRAGDRSMLDDDDDFTDVYSRSILARTETDGLFDPFFRGGYDPTGLVKGWAVERAFGIALAPLITQGSIAAAAINADVWATALLAAPLRDVDRLVGEHELTAFLVLGPERFLVYSNGRRTKPVEHDGEVVAQRSAAVRGGKESADDKESHDKRREVLR